MPVYPFLHLPSPTQLKSLEETSAYLRRMWESLQAMRKGKIECVTSVTLRASQTTTVLTDIRLSPQSVVIFDPQTANAAAELYGGTMYVLTANRGDGSWTITHASAVSTDRTFACALIG